MTYKKLSELNDEIAQYNIGMHCNACRTGTVVDSIFFTDSNIQVKCTRCKLVTFYQTRQVGRENVDVL